ncbi:MAG: ArnT family glycosyltransferase [Tropicimonas sp.]|uniref:ArnT family glycosyltransferase n=1 Tax=Tropicimonas sp. TaxID=2067044 RepID=UPI003A849F14
MPNAAATRAERSGWLLPATLITLAITLLRVALLAVNRTDLFVDEAQYWLWGQELAFGYYSKPPLIGWTIRAVTGLAGSDAAFWIRLPAPLLHGATALLLGAIAARQAGRAAAIWVSAAYLTLPMVSVGSAIISTDTIMVPFLALALLAWLRGLDTGGSYPWAIVAGLALGIAFLGKYAAVYFLISAGLAAAFLWQARPGWGPALAGLAAFLIAISPNLIWNIANGMSTLEHTLDNADWVREPDERARLNLPGLAAFLGAQFIVFGPVFFAVLLRLALCWRARTAEQRFWLLFSIPVIAIVSVQALLSEAYANWAATAYLGGTLLVVPWLLDGRGGWLRAGLAFNLALALAIPLLTVFGTGLRAGGDLLLARYLGRDEMSQAILDAARAEGLDTVVAEDRDILADLFYFNRGGAIAVYARPVDERAPNHYVLKHSMPRAQEGSVLLVAMRRDPKTDCPVVRVGHLEPETGAYKRRSQKLFRVDAQCLVARSSP